MAPKTQHAPLKIIFSYLILMVSGNICKIDSWKEVMNKVQSRRFKWKAKIFSV